MIYWGFAFLLDEWQYELTKLPSIWTSGLSLVPLELFVGFCIFSQRAEDKDRPQSANALRGSASHYQQRKGTVDPHFPSANHTAVRKDVDNRCVSRLSKVGRFMLTIFGFFTILLRTNWFSDFAAMEKSVQNRVCPKNC